MLTKSFEKNPTFYAAHVKKTKFDAKISFFTLFLSFVHRPQKLSVLLQNFA
jgi:hypothetical protein